MVPIQIEIIYKDEDLYLNGRFVRKLAPEEKEALRIYNENVGDWLKQQQEQINEVSSLCSYYLRVVRPYLFLPSSTYLEEIKIFLTI